MAGRLSPQLNAYKKAVIAESDKQKKGKC